MKVWDLQNHRVLKNWEFHEDSIYSLAVNDNFSRIVTGSRKGEIYITDLPKGAFTKVDNIKEQITSIALKCDGDLMIYASSTANKIYEYGLKKKASSPKKLVKNENNTVIKRNFGIQTPFNSLYSIQDIIKQV